MCCFLAVKPYGIFTACKSAKTRDVTINGTHFNQAMIMSIIQLGTPLAKHPDPDYNKQGID